jgi:glutamate dehydrogenase/leucine dehydrogenase
MKGIMGCNRELAPGTVIMMSDGVTSMRIIGPATEEQARKIAAQLGQPEVTVVPGEMFYEVETTVLVPASGNN